MELVKAHVLDLLLVKYEISQWGDSVAICDIISIPGSQFSIIAACNNKPVFIDIPIQSVTLILMSC